MRCARQKSAPDKNVADWLLRLNLTPAVVKLRMTRITRIRIAFTKGGSLFRIHPPGESSRQGNLFFIRDIRDIRGSNGGGNGSAI